jgi:hypothetical protein
MESESRRPNRRRKRRRISAVKRKITKRKNQVAKKKMMTRKKRRRRRRKKTKIGQIKEVDRPSPKTKRLSLRTMSMAHRDHPDTVEEARDPDILSARDRSILDVPSDVILFILDVIASIPDPDILSGETPYTLDVAYEAELTTEHLSCQDSLWRPLVLVSNLFLEKLSLWTMRVIAKTKMITAFLMIRTENRMMMHGRLEVDQPPPERPVDQWCLVLGHEGETHGVLQPAPLQPPPPTIAATKRKHPETVQFPGRSILAVTNWKILMSLMQMSLLILCSSRTNKLLIRTEKRVYTQEL